MCTIVALLQLFSCRAGEMQLIAIVIVCVGHKGLGLQFQQQQQQQQQQHPQEVLIRGLPSVLRCCSCSAVAQVRQLLCVSLPCCGVRIVL